MANYYLKLLQGFVNGNPLFQNMNDYCKYIVSRQAYCFLFLFEKKSQLVIFSFEQPVEIIYIC